MGLRTVLSALDKLGYPAQLVEEDTREDPREMRRRERQKWHTFSISTLTELYSAFFVLFFLFDFLRISGRQPR